MVLCTLIACSGGGGDDRLSGISIDSPVEGLSYETSQHRVVGVTNSEGRFLYYPGESINFDRSVEDFENDPDVQALFVTLNETGMFMAGDAESLETRSLRTAEEARVHLLNSLDEYIDADGDGFTVSGGDCDDTNPDANPAGDEICGDGVDQDCDGEDAVCEK